MYKNYKHSLIASINNGLLLIMVDGQIIRTRKELMKYRQREDKGEKFYYAMHFIPNN